MIFFSALCRWFWQGGVCVVSFMAMFSKPSFFVLGSCTKFPMNCCRAGSSEESVKSSQSDNLPVTSLGSSHWLGFGSYLVLILPKFLCSSCWMPPFTAGCVWDMGSTGWVSEEAAVLHCWFRRGGRRNEGVGQHTVIWLCIWTAFRNLKLGIAGVDVSLAWSFSLHFIKYCEFKEVLWGNSWFLQNE